MLPNGMRRPALSGLRGLSRVSKRAGSACAPKGLLRMCVMWHCAPRPRAVPGAGVPWDPVPIPERMIVDRSRRLFGPLCLSDTVTGSQTQSDPPGHKVVLNGLSLRPWAPVGSFSQGVVWCLRGGAPGPNACAVGGQESACWVEFVCISLTQHAWRWILGGGPGRWWPPLVRALLGRI